MGSFIQVDWQDDDDDINLDNDPDPIIIDDPDGNDDIEDSNAVVIPPDPNPIPDMNEPEPEIKEETKDDTKDDEQKDETKEETKDDDIVTRYPIWDIIEGTDMPGIPTYERLLAAIKELMKGDKGTSIFFKLASYHGIPGPGVCTHRTEVFPGWHRIYLREFEKELQKADKKLGNDGKLGLPYWEWENPAKSDKGLPSIAVDLYSEWNGNWPPNWFPDGFRMPRGMNLDRPFKEEVDAGIADKPQQISDILKEEFHWDFASSKHGWYESLEGAHDSLHGVIGGDSGVMGSVPTAAMDIMFWLHHCNVDRIYERYLDIDPETGAILSNSHVEFENEQQRIADEGEGEDLWEEPFPPYEMVRGFNGSDGSISVFDWDRRFDDLLKDLPYFKKDPNKGATLDNVWYPKDTFDIKALGFKYYNLPHPEPLVDNRLREPQTFVVFKNVKISALRSQEYILYVYLVNKKKANRWDVPHTKQDLRDSSMKKYLGGMYYFFGRSERDCVTCKKTGLSDIRINVTKNLRLQRLSRYQVEIKAYVIDRATDINAVIPIINSDLPKPSITGPVFEDVNETLDENNKIGGTNNKNEVKSLQKYLKRYGYYDGNIDGLYKKKTKQAIKDFQKSVGLNVTGIADPSTKKKMTSLKRCMNVDPFAENKVVDTEVKKITKKDKTLTYFVGPSPGYLPRVRVLKAIKYAFKEWADVCGLVFYITTDKKKADIKITWSYFANADDYSKYEFDGPGGTFGRGGYGYVIFDTEERWNIGLTDKDRSELSVIGDFNTYYKNRRPIVSLWYAALHEIGHCVGIPHLKDRNDIMSPYYNPKLTRLSKNDILYAQKLYGKDNNNQVISLREKINHLERKVATMTDLIVKQKQIYDHNIIALNKKIDALTKLIEQPK